MAILRMPAGEGAHSDQATTRFWHPLVHIETVISVRSVGRSLYPCRFDSGLSSLDQTLVRLGLMAT